jgi:ornithine cyclodeaminase
MLVFDSDQVRALLPMPALIEALRAAFSKDSLVPHRQIIALPGGRGERLFLSMPAFAKDGSGAIKLTTVYPDNAVSGRPTIQGALVLFSQHGSAIAVMDGGVITQMRTGAASALASSFLSREDSCELVMAGAGALAPFMILAHACVRPIQRVRLWGRNRERAEAAATKTRAFVGSALRIETIADLDAGVREADIVCCATSSAAPVLKGELLKNGAFVDLVGSFSPERREADDRVVERARLFVDTFEGALSEAGDILQPLRRGLITRDRIEGELADLASGRIKGRHGPDEITLFKSVGTALEDLAAAQLLWRLAEPC